MVRPSLSAPSKGAGAAVYLGDNNLIVGGNNLDTTFVGIIQDGGVDGGTGGSLTKVGTGTLELVFGQTYTGPTAVNDGTLLLNGVITSSPVTVNNGGTIAGHSGVFGSLDIREGGTVSPGGSIGAFTAGDTTFRPGGTYHLELRTDGTGSPGSDWDVLGILGTLDLSFLTPTERFVLDLQTLDAANNPNPLGAWDPDADHIWSLIVTGLQPGGISGFDPTVFEVDTSGFLNPIRGTFDVFSTGIIWICDTRRSRSPRRWR